MAVGCMVQRQRRVSTMPAMQNSVYLAHTGGQHQQQSAQPPQGDRAACGRKKRALLPKNSHAKSSGLVPVLHAAVLANGQVFTGRLQFFQALLLIFSRGQALRSGGMGGCHSAVAFNVLLLFLLRMGLGLRQHHGSQKHSSNAREPNTAHDGIT